VDDRSSEDHKIQFESQTSKIDYNSSQNHQSHIIQDLTLLNQSQLSNSITNKKIHIFKKVL
jgi:hypothetical protein